MKLVPPRTSLTLKNRSRFRGFGMWSASLLAIVLSASCSGSTIAPTTLLNLAGQWVATEIEGAVDANGNPLTITGSVSTWTFNTNGTYSWFLHALPFFNFDGTGTYTLDGNRLTVTGIIANTLFSETPGSTDVIPLTIGDGTFSFRDEEGDRWSYAMVN